MSSTSDAGDSDDVVRRPQDPFVAGRRPTPQDVPERTLTLSGLLGDSDRPGHRRLYFNKQLDYYAEFATEDVLAMESVPTTDPPFVGLDSTRVTLRRTAQVTFTQVRSAAPVDEFDIDARLGVSGIPEARRATPPLLAAQTFEAECPGPTRGGCATDFACGTDNDCPTGFTVCKPRTCNCTDTCRTDCQATCGTCPGQNTCRTCQTCQTCPGQGTCRTCGENTCQTCAGQNTCATCNTCDTCNQRTCRTCDTCNPHVFTCGNNPQC